MTRFSHCLQCGYDLTGLTEERCPECAQSFASEELETIKERFYPSVGYTLRKIILIPIFFTALGACNGVILERVLESVGIIIFSTVGVGLLIYGILESIKLSNRFAWQRAIRTEGRKPVKQATPFVFALVAGLVCCQAFLSVAGFCGGCVCAYVSTHELRFN